MTVRDFLSEKKSVVLERWFDIVLETYPLDASGFIRNRQKQFTNPVGYTIFQGLQSILDALLQEKELVVDEISPLLESFIRIRAVQDL
ncbi:MAG TPA: RsbRD N-terminal domain-containing protein, partial [Thermodesulfovibrionales bacterium]|nr:RsbRD N-terminal domain-containing protein [Thermodesulfovibrionales bacterium]